MKKSIKFLCAMFLVLGVLVLCDSAKASAATRRGYIIGTSNVRVYSNTQLTRGYGWIYPTDEVTVITVTGSYSKVTYPISGGRYKTGYIATGNILTATGGNTYTSRGRFTTYRRDNTNNTYGYVDNNDRVLVLGARGSFTQIKYPVSGGYKYAFAKTSDVDAYLKDIQVVTPDPVPVITDGTVSQNIFNLAKASVGTRGSYYQKWYGASYSTPYCVIYAVYIARNAMANAGYSKERINSIVPLRASTSLLAKYYNSKGRYYSFANWYNSGTGVRMYRNSSTNSYTPRVGDFAAIDNYGSITPDHTGIVIAVNGNSLTMAEGNTGAGTNATRKVKLYTYYKSGSYWYRSDYTRAHVLGFGNPAY